MVKPTESERRRAERIRINAEFATMPSATYISDLSEYGVFVHTLSPAPLGGTLKLRFTVLLDDPVIIEGEGRVVRQQRDPSGMGIEFTDLTPEMILKINDVVSRLRPRDSGPPLEAEPILPDNSDDLGPVPPPPEHGVTFRPPPLPGRGSSSALDDAKTTHYAVVPSATADEPEQ